MNFRFPQREHICEMADKPTMAVDLGFAYKSKSCGLAWKIQDNNERQPENVNFARCIEEVATFLSKHDDSALIVEAPLSGLFDSSGNPKGRTPFERRMIDSQTRTRYWYVGPGAAVSLGAVFLLTRVAPMVSPESNSVNLFEGFISFTPGPSDHIEDAVALLNGLRDPTTAEVHDIEPNTVQSICSVLLVSFRQKSPVLPL